MTSTAETLRSGRPRDAIELVLLDIWRNHLGNPALGVDDDFFTHGGTSLQAVRTLSEIRRRTGVSLPLPAMARAGSVTAMARLLRDGYADTPTPVVPIRRGSPGGPPRRRKRPFPATRTKKPRPNPRSRPTRAVWTRSSSLPAAS